MDVKTKKSCLNRLSRIEGQVRGVRNMVEDGRYCIDILTQVNAARAALDRVEQEVLREHLQSCVTHAFHKGSLMERQQKIEELIKVLDSQRR
ncbi:MAG: metal-sensitive transcriptional regulator [Pseudomonadota bacterium]